METAKEKTRCLEMVANENIKKNIKAVSEVA